MILRLDLPEDVAEALRQLSIQRLEDLETVAVMLIRKSLRPQKIDVSVTTDHDGSGY